MVDLNATNEKLRDRSERIVMEITDLPRAKARALLRKSNGKVKAAIVMQFRKASYERAVEILNECNQSLRKAIETNR